MTKAAHGLSTGDVIHIQNHATNTAANRIARVTVLTSSTFSLQDLDGDDIAGNGIGGGTGYFYTASKIPLCVDFRNAILHVATAGTATLTVKVGASSGKSASSIDSPDFADTQAVANLFDFIQLIDLEDASPLDGDDGVAFAGADAIRKFEANINASRWISCIISAWTQGAVTVTLLLTDNQ